MSTGRTNVGGGRMPSYEIKINDKFSTVIPAPTNITQTYTIPEDGYYLLGLNTSSGDIGSGTHPVISSIAFTGNDMSDGENRPVLVQEQSTGIINQVRAQTRIRFFTYLKTGTVVTYKATSSDNVTIYSYDNYQYNAYFAVKLSNNIDFTTVPLYPKISV